MSSPAPALPPPIADVFCRVIDNLGDVGVCWRLSQILAQAGWQVRLWVDDARALAFMAPAHVQAPESQAGVCVRDWTLASDAGLLSRLAAADLWVEGFGCELPTAFVAHAVRTRAHPPRWVNLEYLSAEDWVPRLHGLPSPVTTGPAQGWTKQFIYPGFEATTGGLLREPDLLSRQAGFEPLAWLAQMGVTARPQALRVSLFCYEPPALAAWLVHLSQQAQPIDLLVTAGRAQQAVQAAHEALGWTHSPERLRCVNLPWLSQTEFDQLLWACDVNAVRGEDSLVRAIWAGQALVWQLYPQDDLAHHAKLEAFLKRAQLPPDWSEFHRDWNGVPSLHAHALLPLNAHSVSQARARVQSLRAELMQWPPLQAALMQTP